MSGALLASSLVLALVAAALLILDGAFPAFSALLRGSLEEAEPHAFVFGLGNILWAVAWASLLGGFTLLTHLLGDAGDQYLAKLSLVAMTVATLLALLEATFGFTVTPWAMGEAATTGVTPEIYTVLRRWTGGMQTVYIVLALGGQAGFAVALLQTGLVPIWVGRFTLIWSLGWLVVLALGIPAIALVAPAVIGVALLVT